MHWQIGQAYSAETGKRYGVTFYSFESKHERNEFCEDGGDFPTSMGWRELVLSNDCELRAALKKDEVIRF